MTGPLDGPALLRVRRGNPDAAELAALTALLLSLTATGTPPDDDGPRARHAKAGWTRPERAPGPPQPRSWSAPPGTRPGAAPTDPPPGRNA
jgi:hypothetical protein